MLNALPAELLLCAPRVPTCRGASAAAIVYDITVQESFEKAKYWVKELQKNSTGEISAVPSHHLPPRGHPNLLALSYWRVIGTSELAPSC